MVLAFANFVPMVYHPATRQKGTGVPLKREFIDEIPDQPGNSGFSGLYGGGSGDRRDNRGSGISMGPGGLFGREVISSSNRISRVYDAAGTRAEIEAIRAGSTGGPSFQVPTLRTIPNVAPKTATVTQTKRTITEVGRGVPLNVKVLPTPGGRYNVVIDGVVFPGMSKAGGKQIIREHGGNAEIFEGEWTHDIIRTIQPVGPPVPGPIYQYPGVPTKGEDPMDLGNLLGNLGTAYINARYSQPTPAYQPVDYNVGGVNVDPFDVFTDDSTVIARRAPCRKRRRRRRRLATASDIKDIAALKSTMSPSEFKTWLATHPQ